MKTPEEIQSLISKLIKGDSIAWSKFMKEFHPRVSGFVNYKASNLDIENIISDFYLKLIDKDYYRLKHFSYGGELGFWNYLKSILLNQIETESKKAYFKRNQSLGKEYQNTLIDARPEPDNQFIENESVYQDITEQMFLEAVMQLKNLNHQESIYLLYRGHTNDEISKIMKKPLNTILSWNKRAKEKLKIILENMRKVQ